MIRFVANTFTGNGLVSTASRLKRSCKAWKLLFERGAAHRNLFGGNGLSLLKTGDVKGG